MTIATVRPATILADVAVAVHPDDERYRDLVGKEVIVPFVERRVPVIADERVEPEFGTGALKVTPGHDPTDFEIGRDHELPELAVIGPDGRMNDEAGELAGLTQEEAGERVLAWCEERGLLDRTEPYRHSIGTCERCHTRVEPLIMLQWWCAMEELAAPAIAAVREGRVRFTPERFARVCLDWLENVRPWCISQADLVGPPDPGLVLPRRPRDRRRDHAGRLRRVRLDRADARTRTCSTRGSRRRSTRSRPSAGPSRRRSSRPSTRATCSRPRATSSSSGSRG